MQKRSSEVGMQQELLKLKSVTFVTGLLGIIDLMQPVAEISLAMQTVNQLPWELDDMRKEFEQHMRLLGADLKAHKFDRIVDRNGRSEPALKLLARHQGEMRQAKFSCPGPKDTSNPAVVDLSLTAEQRGLRQWLAGGPPPASASEEFDRMLDQLGDVAIMIADKLGKRLTPPEDEYRFLRHMGYTLDLRKMAFDPAYLQSQQSERSLQVLYDWMQERSAGYDGTDSGTSLDDLPSFEEVRRQQLLLADRLRSERDRPTFSQWKGASGIIIMESVFTWPRFYAGCEAFVYLFEHMATKSMCEAVIEGMGGMWDRCNTDGRHQAFATGAEESVIAWSAPKPYHPASVAFINHALNEMFGFDADGKPKPHHFKSSDHSHNAGSVANMLAGSKVINRHKRDDQPRLPDAMYDTSTKP